MSLFLQYSTSFIYLTNGEEQDPLTVSSSGTCLRSNPPSTLYTRDCRDTFRTTVRLSVCLLYREGVRNKSWHPPLRKWDPEFRSYPTRQVYLVFRPVYSLSLSRMRCRGNLSDVQSGLLASGPTVSLPHVSRLPRWRGLPQPRSTPVSPFYSPLGPSTIRSTSEVSTRGRLGYPKSWTCFGSTEEGELLRYSVSKCVEDYSLPPPPSSLVSGIRPGFPWLIWQLNLIPNSTWPVNRDKEEKWIVYCLLYCCVL